MNKGLWQVTVLVSAALVMSSCGPKGGKTVTPTSPAIKGVINPLPAGTTSVRENENAGQGLQVSAPVKSDGRFTLALPSADMVLKDPAKVATLMPRADIFGYCENTASDNKVDEDLKIYPINYLTTNKGDRLIAPIDDKASDYNYYAYWFSNKDTTLDFKGDCLSIGKVDTQLTLKKGWNVVKVHTIPGESTTYSATPIDNVQRQWRVDTRAMGAQGVAANILTPWRNLPEYRNR